MNDFTQRYKNAMGGKRPKSNNKDQKKQMFKALKLTLEKAMEGQVAGLMHLGEQYIMLRHDVLQQLISTGGVVVQTLEQQEFFVQHQILLTIMSNLKVEFDDQRDMYAEIDSLTFDFSAAMQGLKKERDIALKQFNELLESQPFLMDLKLQVEKPVRERVIAQLTGKQPEQKSVENNGKLT